MDIYEETFKLLYDLLINDLSKESKSFLLPLEEETEAVFAALGKALFNEKIIEVITKQLESDG